jgi:hypothetical protein
VDTDPLFIPRSTITSRLGKYSAWGLSGKTMGLFLLLLVLASLIGSFYLNQASQTTAAGFEIARLTREREYWRQENADLRKQIAVMESLSRTRARAEELGFVEPEVVEYLVVERLPTENALSEDSTSSHTSERRQLAPQPAQSRDWLGDLVDQFESWISIEH